MSEINDNDIVEKLRKVKNEDVEEFSLKNKSFIGKVVDVYDGDTCKIVFYLDGKLVKFSCRLNGIDTPELKPFKTKVNREEEIEKAKKCRDRLIELCCGNVDVVSSDKIVYIRCDDFDKYGRLLVKIYETKEGDCSINEILVKEGLAKCYDGGKKN